MSLEFDVYALTRGSANPLKDVTMAVLSHLGALVSAHYCPPTRAPRRAQLRPCSPPALRALQGLPLLTAACAA